MKTMQSIYHLLRADYLERVRRSSFLIVLALVVFAGYIYTPAATAGYRSVSFNVAHSATWYRGIYNSAWIATQVALWATFWLVGIGFFLVRNAIERDTQTGVGQIIASTPLSKVAYLLGKMLSNLAVLTTILGVVVFATAIMQLLRGEDTHLDLWQLVSPFLFIVLPSVVLVAALAVLFECITWLRGAVGSVIYIFLYVFVIILSFGSEGQGAGTLFDVLGVSYSVQQMQNAVHAAFPSFKGDINIGTSPTQVLPHTFVWQGNAWPASVIQARLVWVAVALAVTLFAALFFSRFDPAREKRVRKQGALPVETQKEEEEEGAFAALHLTPLPASGQSRWTIAGAILLSELRILFKEVPWWWYIGALVWIVLSLFLPFGIAHSIFLPIAWLWPLPIWSSLGNREKRQGTHQLVFSTAHLLERQFPLLYLAGVLIALFAASGMLVRCLLVGDITAVIVLLIGALFIPALALFCGVWTSGRRLFEIVYISLWYIGGINQTPALDFMGISKASLLMGIPFIFGGIALVLLLAAVSGRKLQMQI